MTIPAAKASANEAARAAPPSAAAVAANNAASPRASNDTAKSAPTSMICHARDERNVTPKTPPRKPVTGSSWAADRGETARRRLDAPSSNKVAAEKNFPVHSSQTGGIQAEAGPAKRVAARTMAPACPAENSARQEGANARRLIMLNRVRPSIAAR